MAVGKLIASLPLHEYIDMSSGTFSDKALVLQTAEEPYGLTVNYDFTKESPLDMTDEIAMTPIDTRSRQILSSGLNDPQTLDLASPAHWIHPGMPRLWLQHGTADRLVTPHGKPAIYRGR